MTETGLQDTEYQRDCVQVNGYNTVFKNRTGKRGRRCRFLSKRATSIQRAHRPCTKLHKSSL